VEGKKLRGLKRPQVEAALPLPVTGSAGETSLFPATKCQPEVNVSSLEKLKSLVRRRNSK
jgi:hypothetical protein